jgi:hypothetical protein
MPGTMPPPPPFTGGSKLSSRDNHRFTPFAHYPVYTCPKIIHCPVIHYLCTELFAHSIDLDRLHVLTEVSLTEACGLLAALLYLTFHYLNYHLHPSKFVLYFTSALIAVYFLRPRPNLRQQFVLAHVRTPWLPWLPWLPLTCWPQTARPELTAC